MLNQIPIVGWMLDLFFKASMAVPLWFFWTAIGIGAKFFPFLPAPFLTIGLLDCIGMLIILDILRQVSPFRGPRAVVGSSKGDKP
jgi:hypothetical protein